jgi:prepilin-type N-terminal cleavage/methylation domain-containing protein
MHRGNFRYGFTLIELLIVVAIIAILAAIAVPNFLEAQTRAKISRVKNDLRTLATGLEAYMVDSNKYPWPLIGALGGGVKGHFIWWVTELTTPVAYLTTV